MPGPILDAVLRDLLVYINVLGAILFVAVLGILVLVFVLARETAQVNEELHERIRILECNQDLLLEWTQSPVQPKRSLARILRIAAHK